MDKNPDRIAEEAAEYLARRAPNNKPVRGDGLAGWLKEDPAHAQAYTEAHDLWEELGPLSGDKDLQSLKRADMKVHGGRRRRFKWMRSLAAAAALVLALGGSFYYLSGYTKPVTSSYTSTADNRSDVLLSDGTKVVLNIDSEIATSYSRGDRDVVLVRGEANFEVAHDKERPFVVRVGEASVTALGTRFQVLREGSDTLVTLLEGSVNVAGPRGQQTLLPNEQAKLSPSGTIAVATIDPLLETGWMEGWLRFRDTPLSKVIAQSNRYSQQQIRLADPSLAGVSLSGNFKIGDSGSIASAAEMILPVELRREGQDYVLVPAQ